MEKKCKNGVFIVSLNSQRVKEAIGNRDCFQFNDEAEQLDIYVFDTYEVLNAIFFHNKDAGEMRASIETLIGELKENFVTHGIHKRNIIRYSEHKENLAPYLILLYKEFYSNRKFERHCKNQIFKNLQPKLKKIGCDSNRSYLVELLLPFLIAEIAFFLYTFDQSTYCKVFGLEAEMEIIQSIKELKYPAFKELVMHRTDYTQITMEKCSV